MRRLDDPEVQALAVDLAEGGALNPWPSEYAKEIGVPQHVCAMVGVVDRGVRIAFNDQHKCARPDRTMLHIAAVVLDYFEHGPDEGWNQYSDGSGHQTFISEPGPAARDSSVVIPPSELPPI